MHLPEHFISCDWGTTNFRLRVVDTDSLRVVAEQQTDRGIKSLYAEFRAGGGDDQYAFFAAYLQEQLNRLPAAHRAAPLVLSGMASANIGLCELPYAPLPLPQDGSTLVWRRLTLPAGTEALLISGARDDESVMRGEEIQAIGLAEHLQPYGRGLLLLPGTHSKHIRYADDHFLALRTYMTGELFALLSQHSILADALAAGPLDAAAEAAFREGLTLGLGGRLSASLFGIRARYLLNRRPATESYYYLSGLLIGDELAYLQSTTDTIFLAATEPVFTLYRRALEQLRPPRQLQLFDGPVLEQALLAGKRKILIHHDR